MILSLQNSQSNQFAWGENLSALKHFYYFSTISSHFRGMGDFIRQCSDFLTTALGLQEESSVFTGCRHGNLLLTGQLGVAEIEFLFNEMLYRMQVPEVQVEPRLLAIYAAN